MFFSQYSEQSCELLCTVLLGFLSLHSTHSIERSEFGHEYEPRKQTAQKLRNTDNGGTTNNALYASILGIRMDLQTVENPPQRTLISANNSRGHANNTTHNYDEFRVIPTNFQQKFSPIKQTLANNRESKCE